MENLHFVAFSRNSASSYVKNVICVKNAKSGFMPVSTDQEHVYNS